MSTCCDGKEPTRVERIVDATLHPLPYAKQRAREDKCAVCRASYFGFCGAPFVPQDGPEVPIAERTCGCYIDLKVRGASEQCPRWVSEAETPQYWGPEATG